MSDRYGLKETHWPDCARHTEWNAGDSDVTVVSTMGEPEGGTA